MILAADGERDGLLGAETNERLLPRLAHAEHVVELPVLAEPDALAALDVDEPLGEQVLAVVGAGKTPPALLGEEQDAGLRARPAHVTSGDPVSGVNRRKRQAVQLAECLGTDGMSHCDFLSRLSKLLSEPRCRY